jgi:hypothetical protein
VIAQNFSGRRVISDGSRRRYEVAMGPNASRLDTRFAMAETPKLSVEKALEKLRAADATKSKSARRTEEIDALDDEIKRMRAQRLRLDRHQRRSTKSD